MHYTDIKEFANTLPTKGGIIAVDYGYKKLGIAVSDEGRKLAMPLKILKNNVKEPGKILKELKELCLEKNIVGLVIGLPLQLDSTETELSKKIHELADYWSLWLELPVFLQDERLTTKAANQILKTMEMTRYQRAQVDDKISASLILESVIDAMARP